MSKWISNRHRVLGPLLIVAGLLIIPWLVYLAFHLPSTAKASNWSTMWIGLDVAEAIGLIVTGILQWRRSRHRSLPAAFTSALMALDAWVDITTSAAGSARAMAIVMGVALEIPVAIACLALAIATAPSASVLTAPETLAPPVIAPVTPDPGPQPAITHPLTRSIKSITPRAHRKSLSGPSASA